MKMTVKRITYIGLFAALSYVGFRFLKFEVPMPDGNVVPIHMGNSMVILAALLIGGLEGGAAGSLGMTIGDLMSPKYFVYAPKTFICKLGIGLVCGLFAHKIFKIRNLSERKKLYPAIITSSVIGMLFNVIFDPLIGYYYKTLILGKEVAKLSLAINVGVTSFNALTSVIVGVLGYMLLKDVIKH